MSPDLLPRSPIVRGVLTTLPYLLTALGAVALSLWLQRTLNTPTTTSQSVATPSVAIASQAPVLTPTVPAPRPTLPPPDERVLSQELLDVRALGEQRATFIYLLKAESQLRLAEEALLQNNIDEVDRTLLDVEVTLAMAYERSADASRSPILQLREQLGLIHDDLYVRPEGIDDRLRRLRQSTLTLVNEVP